MWNTHFQRPPSPVPLYLPARKHSTSMQHFCLTDAPGQYSLLRIGISVTPMPIKSFLLRLTTNWGLSALHPGEWIFCTKHHADTTSSKMKSSLFFDSYLGFVGYNHWSVWEGGGGDLGPWILLHHSKSFTLGLLYKVLSWQQSSVCGSVTAWGGQLAKLHCKPCWVLSTLHLIWANVNQKLTLHPQEGSDIVVKHESADRVSSNMLLLYH